MSALLASHARAKLGLATRQYASAAASSAASPVDQMIEYAMGQRKDNPNMAVDVLRSGLAHPMGGPADTARLQLALAQVEAERNNWDDAQTHSSASLRLLAPLAAAPGVPSAAAAAELALAAGSLGVRALVVQGLDAEAHALAYETEQALRAAAASAPSTSTAARVLHTRSLGLLVAAAGGEAAATATIASSSSSGGSGSSGSEGGGGGGGARPVSDAAAAATAAAGQLAEALGSDVAAALQREPSMADAALALGQWRMLVGQGDGQAAEAEAESALTAAAAAAAAAGPSGGGGAAAAAGRQHRFEVEADALMGRAQLAMRSREWGQAEELLGAALKAAEGAHGERSAQLAPLLTLLGYTYSRSARVTFAEGLLREAAKLLRLDPGRQPGLAAPKLPQHAGLHASLGALLSWRTTQLLSALPNRGSEAAAFEAYARQYWANGQGSGQRDIEAVLGGKGHLKGEGGEGSGLVCSSTFRRAWPRVG